MTTPIDTRTLRAPGVELAYDVRSVGGSDEPPLLLIGSPMSASGFGTLASHFADRTVVTYDPRGCDRSRRTDVAMESTPEEHADDLHRLISALAVGPVDVFASSGGAVNALELVTRHPGDVRTLVAHEPPLAALLPDREAALAACRDIHDTYLRSGVGPATAKFIRIVSYPEPIPDDFADQPAPDPAAFGLPTEDDGSRDDPLVGQNIISCTAYQPDIDALRAASTRIVLGAGTSSEGTLANRGAHAMAESLGSSAVPFPGGHGGFMGGEYGQPPEDPDGFAATLRAVLAASSAGSTAV